MLNGFLIEMVFGKWFFDRKTVFWYENKSAKKHQQIIKKIAIVIKNRQFLLKPQSGDMIKANHLPRSSLVEMCSKVPNRLTMFQVRQINFSLKSPQALYGVAILRTRDFVIF